MTVEQLVTNVLVALGGTSAAIALFLRIAKNAIVFALRQAAEKELIDLKARLDYQFAAMLAEQRAIAEHGLEQFKSQLSMRAEVRRVLAARRLDATLQIIEASMPLQDFHSKSDLMAELDKFITITESHRVLFPRAVEDHFREFMTKAASVRQDLLIRRGASFRGDELTSIANTFINHMRQQIGVDDELSADASADRAHG